MQESQDILKIPCHKCGHYVNINNTRCHICGYKMSDTQSYIKRKYAQNINEELSKCQYKCSKCNNDMYDIDISIYKRQTMMICKKCKNAIPLKIEDDTIKRVAFKYPNRTYAQNNSANRTTQYVYNSKPISTPQYTPKCPVCNSPNIKKISTSKKVTHAALFGFWSKTARSQWVCSNCGNKW